jgi:hypothetical protein
MAVSYYDTRTGKTYCGRCDSASWTVLTDCSACGDGCCDDCATLEGKSDLLCSRCALKPDLPELQQIRIDPVSLTLPEFTKGEVA